MSSALGSSDGILIRIMRVEDYPEVMRFLGENFYKTEPICAASGENLQDYWEEVLYEYNISMIKQGTCLLALNEKEGGTIVGITLAGRQTPSDVEKNRQFAASLKPNAWGKMTVLLSEVEMKTKLFERYGISKALYTDTTNVLASMQGKGLGRRLTATLMELGRSMGYPLLYGFCTSAYSARSKEKLGMKCIYKMAYADYKDDRGEVVFKLPAPHTHLQVVAIRL